MSLKPDAGTTTMRDTSNVALDGDADGNPGGTYQFWFQSNAATNTIYVDKTPPNVPTGALGSITNPYTNLAAALGNADLNNPASPKKIVRILGNPGSASTFADGCGNQVSLRWDSEN